MTDHAHWETPFFRAARLPYGQVDRKQKSRALGPRLFSLEAQSAGLGLQHSDSALQLRIDLRRRVLGFRLIVVVVRAVIAAVIVITVRNENVRSDGNILDGLAVRRVILRDREDDGRTVRHFDQFLHGADAESLIAKNVTASAG